MFKLKVVEDLPPTFSLRSRNERFHHPCLYQTKSWAHFHFCLADPIFGWDENDERPRFVWTNWIPLTSIFWGKHPSMLKGQFLSNFQFFPSFSSFPSNFQRFSPFFPGDELLERPAAAQREARHAAPGAVLPGRRRRHSGAGDCAALRAAAAGDGRWDGVMMFNVNIMLTNP